MLDLFTAAYGEPLHTEEVLNSVVYRWDTALNEDLSRIIGEDEPSVVLTLDFLAHNDVRQCSINYAAQPGKSS